MKDLSRRHKIAIITSLHQPNNNLLNMFDKLYVLAKGGTNIYFGSPNHLSSTLSQCRITLNEKERPIEKLINISAKGINDRNFKILNEKTKVF